MKRRAERGPQARLPTWGLGFWAKLGRGVGFLLWDTWPPSRVPTEDSQSPHTRRLPVPGRVSASSPHSQAEQPAGWAVLRGRSGLGEALTGIASGRSHAPASNHEPAEAVQDSHFSSSQHRQVCTQKILQSADVWTGPPVPRVPGLPPVEAARPSRQPWPRAATPKTGTQSCPPQGPPRRGLYSGDFQVSLGTLRSGADGCGVRLSRGPAGTAGGPGPCRGTWPLAFCSSVHGHAGKGSVLSHRPAQSWATPPHPAALGLDP